MLQKTKTTNKKQPKQNYTIKAVNHALNVLEEFQHHSEIGITVLSQKLGLHKNNIFRLLATLVSRGYIEQNQYTGNYRLGYKTVSLGHIFTRNTGIVRAAAPVLEKLSVELNETLYIGIQVGNNIFYIFDIETTHALRVSSRIGESLPMFCTAVGKLFLSYLDESKYKEILQQSDLKPLTEYTITDKALLLKEIEKTRERGYALDQQETNRDIICVGMPVFDHSGRMAAGISVSAPIYRLTEDKIETDCLPLLREASLEISRALGFVPMSEE